MILRISHNAFNDMGRIVTRQVDHNVFRTPFFDAWNIRAIEQWVKELGQKLKNEGRLTYIHSCHILSLSIERKTVGQRQHRYGSASDPKDMVQDLWPRRAQRVI